MNAVGLGVHKASRLSSAHLIQPEFVAGRAPYPSKDCRAGLSVTQRDRGAISWQKENRNYILHNALLLWPACRGAAGTRQSSFYKSIQLLQSLHLIIAPLRAGAPGPSIMQR